VPVGEARLLRDGKRGTPQIIYGLALRQGRPTGRVEVFDGNLHDQATVPAQIEKAAPTVLAVLSRAGL